MQVPLQVKCSLTHVSFQTCKTKADDKSCAATTLTPPTTMDGKRLTCTAWYADAMHFLVSIRAVVIMGSFYSTFCMQPSCVLSSPLANQSKWTCEKPLWKSRQPDLSCAVLHLTICHSTWVSTRCIILVCVPSEALVDRSRCL